MAGPRIVIVGAGPAGLTLAWLLVSNGIEVHVLERHVDFEREFRGELVQPSSVAAFGTLGILEALAERGLAIANVERRLLVGLHREVMAFFRTAGEQGMLISQPGLLQLLHEACSRFPHYRIDFGTTAVRPVIEQERVIALETRSAAGKHAVGGDLFVVCNGRNSVLRKDVGVEVESFAQPANALWLRFDLSDVPEALPKGVDVHMFGGGVVVVSFPTTRSRLQIAYSAPGDLGKLRKDLPELKQKLLPTLPESLRAVVDRKLDADTEWQVLKITIDRLKKWWVPGMLFLGDAAHTMSPSGGVGLNTAIRDAIVAANHLIDTIRADQPIDGDVFDRIEAERRPEIEELQAGQIRAAGMVMRPLPVLHVAFTMIGTMAWMFSRGGTRRAAERTVDVKHPVSIRPSAG